MSPSELAPADAVERIVKLLKTAAKPLTFSQLRKSARLEDAALRSALEAAVSQGGVYRWPDFARRQYFWSQSPDEAAQQAILTVASEFALSRNNLLAKARKRVTGFPQQALERVVASLLSDQQLQQVPGFTAGKLLIRAGKAEAYAASARAFIEQKFRKAGLDPAPFLTSPSPHGFQPAAEASTNPGALINPGELILDAIRSLEPVSGVPVSTQRLRNHLPALGKRELDAAALELRKAEQVFLSLHHDPHNITQQERDLLIDGGDGTYYVAIAIR